MTTIKREIGTPLEKASDLELGTVLQGRSGEWYIVKTANNKTGKAWKKCTKTELAKLQNQDVQENKTLQFTNNTKPQVFANSNSNLIPQSFPISSISTPQQQHFPMQIDHEGDVIMS